MLFDKHQFRYVYHLAAYAAEGLSHFIRRFNYTNNVIGSINLINESVRHEVESFVFTSRSPCTARSNTDGEDQMPRPKDPYGVAKYAVELTSPRPTRCSASPMWSFARTTSTASTKTGRSLPERLGIFMNQLMSGRP